MTITHDALREIHLGGRLEEGVIRWSADTERRSLELVTAKARDAVATFLDADYATAQLERIEAAAGVPVTNPAEAVKIVSQRLRFTEAQQNAILEHFITGADVTAGGMMHAVTSAAQTVDDADVAHEMEAAALRALDITATL
jgi:hypothetical protein